MLVTSDLVLLTLAGIKTDFSGAYLRSQVGAAWKEIATEIPTTLPIQNYAWLGRSAVMRPFPDEAENQAALEHDYKLADIIYKGELTVQRKALEDDQYGEIMMRARQLGQEPTRHWNQLAYLGLASAFSTVCYDGQFMCSTAHQEGSSPSQSNLTSNSLTDAALETAFTAMRAYVDDKGIPMEISPDTLIVGPALERRAWQLVGQDIRVVNIGDGTVGSGATAATPQVNFFNRRIKKLVVNPYLIGTSSNPASFYPGGPTYTAAYNWFLADTSREVKPIVIQSRSDVPITLETDMDQPSQKIKEIYNFTARGRYVQGYGLWQMLYGSNATS
jgi:phage major head subunit gpT-like protein